MKQSDRRLHRANALQIHASQGEEDLRDLGNDRRMQADALLEVLQFQVPPNHVNDSDGIPLRQVWVERKVSCYHHR